jgi:hypothetical protein
MATIEELKADADAKAAISKAAMRDYDEALTRLKKAVSESSGLLGHLVEYERKSGWGRNSRTERRRMVVKHARKDYDRFRLYGIRVKKDGSLGALNDDVYQTDVTDLGIWEGHTAKQA